MAATIELFAIACLGLALRSMLSMHSYSGAGIAPMFGDYEAQRHWQEVTVNLDVAQWYQNGTDNDLLYWGLDYPPLTAYHSLLVGRVAKSVDPRFVELHASRGFESKQHKSFMRLTVLVADILIYIPATLTMCLSIDRSFLSNLKLPLFLLCMLYPGQSLVDNGHFQYNNISLGLAALAIAAILRDRHCLAALAFTLALNYKQMELYHALPFFSYLLAACFSSNSFGRFASKLTAIAATVIATFVVLWWPWLRSLDAALEVLKRLFPVGRGVFEDKVASFWCAANVVFKIKKHFTNNQMALICLAVTLIAALPANIGLFMRRNKITFLLALFNTAAAFFLFSFQVHEKTILLLALPALCLFNWWPREMLWFLEVSVFSMMPLLAKDKLWLPSIASTVVFHLAFKRTHSGVETGGKREILLNWGKGISELLMLAIVIASLSLPAPSRWPDLWPLIISVVSCAHFVLFLIWGNFQQFTFKLPVTKKMNKVL